MDRISVRSFGALGFVVVLAGLTGAPLPVAGATGWVVSWTASGHGPYPSGNAVAQPDLAIPFPTPTARDQSFRMIVRPGLWGCQARVRLSNAFGTQPVTFDGVHVGLQLSGSAVVPATNQPVSFAGAAAVTVAAGETGWSDPVALPFACMPGAEMAGRKLAISFHVAGESGPMTWHAKALQTSYLTGPAAGARGADPGEAAFPFSTTSWFFVDAVEVQAPVGAQAVVALGDSITDGTNTTLNGDDRWPDVLGRRLVAALGEGFPVVNAGIGGNRILPGPAGTGGPSALERLERDVLSLSGVTTVIWLEGINDLGRTPDASVESLTAGLSEGVSRMKARGLRVVGATVTTALGSTNANHGTPEQDVKRRALNDFIRTSGLFDAVADFDAAVLDPATGRLRPEMVHNTTTGGAGDGLHPNRLGYQAMAAAVDIASLGLVDIK